VKAILVVLLLSPSFLLAQQSSGAWANMGPRPAAVEAIAVDPRSSGTLYMGTIAGGIRKSVDEGSTWNAINTGLTNLPVLALAMDASGPEIVYAGTAGSGLFKTDNGGVSVTGIGSPASSPAVVAPTFWPSNVAGRFDNATRCFCGCC